MPSVTHALWLSAVERTRLSLSALCSRVRVRQAVLRISSRSWPEGSGYFQIQQQRGPPGSLRLRRPRNFWVPIFGTGRLVCVCAWAKERSAD